MITDSVNVGSDYGAESLGAISSTVMPPPQQQQPLQHDGRLMRVFLGVCFELCRRRPSIGD